MVTDLSLFVESRAKKAKEDRQKHARYVLTARLKALLKQNHLVEHVMSVRPLQHHIYMSYHPIQCAMKGQYCVCLHPNAQQ